MVSAPPFSPPLIPLTPPPTFPLPTNPALCPLSPGQAHACDGSRGEAAETGVRPAGPVRERVRGALPYPGAVPREDPGHLLPHLPLPPRPRSGPAGPRHPSGHKGWFVLRDPGHLLPAASGPPVLCDRGQGHPDPAGEGAAGGSFPALCADTVGASLRVHPHQLPRSRGAQGQGACGHLLGAGRFPFLAEFASLPGGSLWSSLVPTEAMAAQGQKGQGTCPRSQPKFAGFPYSSTLSLLGPIVSQ